MDRFNEILIDFLRSRDDKSKACKIRQLSTSDWDGLLHQAIDQDVAPLLYYHLKKIDPAVYIPKRIAHVLQIQYLQSMRRNMLLYDEFNRVLKILQNKGIKLIALKGVHVAETLYNDIALRPMRDIDLMVRKNDLLQAERELMEMGYGTSERPTIEEQTKKDCHLERLKRTGAVPVEIHWNIMPPESPFNIDIDGMWERAREAQLGGFKVLVLSPEDLILHLCLHVSYNHHFSSRLGHIYDIFEALRYYKNEIDWRRLFTTANAWNARTFVYSALSLSRIMLGAEIPLDALKVFKPDNFEEQILDIVYEYILSTSPLDLPSTFRDLLRRDGPLDRATYLLRGLFPPMATLRKLFSLPVDSRTAYLYYFVRPFDVLIRHGKSMLMMAFKSKEARFSVERERKKIFIERWVRETSDGRR
jgi:hypothetical protein